MKKFTKRLAVGMFLFAIVASATFVGNIAYKHYYDQSDNAFSAVAGNIYDIPTDGDSTVQNGYLTRFYGNSTEPYWWEYSVELKNSSPKEYLRFKIFEGSDQWSEVTWSVPGSERYERRYEREKLSREAQREMDQLWGQLQVRLAAK